MRVTLNKGFGFGFLVIWAFSALLSLSLTGAIIYCAWHFISKYW